MRHLNAQFLKEISTRLEKLAGPHPEIEAAIEMIANSLENNGVVQAFGTGHSEIFTMEMVGRAGGLIATNKLALRTLVLRGDRDLSALGGAEFERDPNVGENLLALFDVRPEDVFIIASNSGVNGSILGVALAAKARGHKVIAVTSLDHTMKVTAKHPSGKRLSEVADVTIDNLAPYGDSAMLLEGGIGVGPVSSITTTFIAQRLTFGVAETIRRRGKTPPVYMSANIPGGDAHNRALEDLYGVRIRREA